MIVFEKVRWKNFLSTGNVFSEIDLQRSRTNLIVGHNGSGKSTILDALTFSLFGKPFRKISKSMLVNSVNEKDTMVEIEFSIGKNSYQVIRGIKPNKFMVYCNGQPWDEDAKAVDQQKNLEQNVLKMNFKSFTQIVVLGSSTFVPFMRLPGQQRREIIEDILDIQVFSVMNNRLKDKIRENNEEIKDLDYQLHLLEEKIELQKQYMLELKKKTDAEIDKKKEKIKEYQQEEESSLGNIRDLTDQVTNLSTEMEEYSKSSSKLKKLNTFLIKLNQKLQTCKKEHEFFEDNHVCPTCTQDLSDEFRADKIEEGKTKLDEMNVGYEELQTAIKDEEKRNEKFLELTQEVNTKNTTITNINYQLMSIRSNIDEISKEIKELEGSTPDKKAEFVKLEGLIEDKKTTKKNCAVSKKDRDVLQVATTLLKDSGIKTRIIKTYLPTMNKLINQFLQSMDFYVNFTLNENFEETIKSRYRDVFSYESFSEGEKARIDISLLLTWRSIAKLKNSVDTNLLILDEIFDGSLDQSGTSDLGWILRNFDDNTNVFVISHKTLLDDKFDRTITVNKDKNYSTLEETVHEVTHALVG
jgi:DNA repair exonuclease SbcCD ATPase subunit|tara:strand:+ start:768 stop:2513 length:1746 start_codon:yes stop_codon:yes gene_type:complete